MEMEKKALIVIDMQECYIGPACKHPFYPDTLIEKVNERIRQAEACSEMVFYVKNKGRMAPAGHVPDFAPGLLLVSDIILVKDRMSLFCNPSVPGLLALHHIDALEVVGIDGNFCVAATAIDAARAGFPVAFPLSYIGIRHEKRFVKTREKLLQAHVQIIESAPPAEGSSQAGIRPHFPA